MKSNLTTGLFAGFALGIFSFIMFPYLTLGSQNSSDLTGFDANDSIRNLTNPVLKMDRNPLANLSNPIANLSNPLANLTQIQ